METAVVEGGRGRWSSAIGLTLVVLAGGLDLSIAANVGLSACIVASVVQATGSVALWFDQLAILSFTGDNEEQVLEALLDANVNVEDVECKAGTITIFAPAEELPLVAHDGDGTEQLERVKVEDALGVPPLLQLLLDAFVAGVRASKSMQHGDARREFVRARSAQPAPSPLRRRRRWQLAP